MAKTVIALFDDMGRARNAAQALKARGFTQEPQVQTGEEFVQRGRVPPMAHEREGFWGGIKNFFDEIGLTTPEQPPSAGEYHPIAPKDGVVLLETSDERAEEAADILDREGAVNVEERMKPKKKADPKAPNVASGLEPDTSGRTPPHLTEVEKYGDIDERALAAGKTGGRRKSRCARVYDCPDQVRPGGDVPKGRRD